jgi:hypothetical protein
MMRILTVGIILTQFNPLNDKLNTIRHLLVLLGAHHILHISRIRVKCINPLNAELNPICYLLALLGAHHILHISRERVNRWNPTPSEFPWSWQQRIVGSERLR